MRAFIIKLVLFINSFYVSAALAADPRSTLLALTHRPTVAEMTEAMNGDFSGPNPFGTPTRNLQTNIMLNAPATIAAFEKIFPGATYAPLGRDAAFLGDLLDGFYRSLGQERIIRVDASGASRTNDQDLLDFMEGLGVDLSQSKGQPPFIMFDQTNFKHDSQSTAYLRSLYSACKQRGCDLAKLLENFNFINTGSNKGMYQHNIVDPTTNIQHFLKQLKEQLQSGKSNQPSAILSVPVDANLTYTAEYHDTFSKFERQADNTVTTRPGYLKHESIRLQILADIYETIKTVRSPEFLSAVKVESEFYGYQFPLIRVTTEQERLQIRKAHQSALDLKSLEEKLNLQRLEYRLKLPLSSNELWKSIAMDTKADIKNATIESHMAALKLALAGARKNRIEGPEIRLAIQPIFNLMIESRAYAGFADDLGTLFKGDVKFQSLFKNEIRAKSEKNLDNMGYYLSKIKIIEQVIQGTPAELAIKNSYGDAFETVTSKVHALFKIQMPSDELVKKMQQEIQSHFRSNLAEGTALMWSLSLEAYSKRLIDRQAMIDPLLNYINSLDLNFKYTRQYLVDVLQKSSFAKEIFFGPLWEIIRKDQKHLFKKYLLLYNELTGEPEEFLYRKLIQSLIRDFIQNKTALDKWTSLIISEIKGFPSSSAEDLPLWIAAIKEVSLQVEKGLVAKGDFATLMLTSLHYMDTSDPLVLQSYRELLISNPAIERLWQSDVIEVQSQVNWNKTKYLDVDMFTYGHTEEESKQKSLNNHMELIRRRVIQQIDSHVAGSNLASYMEKSLTSLYQNSPLEGRLLHLELAAVAYQRRAFNETAVSDSIYFLMNSLDTSLPEVQRAFLNLSQKYPDIKKIFLTSTLYSISQFQNGWFQNLPKYETLYSTLTGHSALVFQKHILKMRYETNLKTSPDGTNFTSFFQTLINGIQQKSSVQTPQLWAYAVELAVTPFNKIQLPTKQVNQILQAALNQNFSEESPFQKSLVEILRNNPEAAKIWENDFQEHLLHTFAKTANIFETYKAITQKAFQIDDATYESNLARQALARFLEAGHLEIVQIQNWLDTHYDPKKGPEFLLKVLHEAFENRRLSEEKVQEFLFLIPGYISASADKNLHQQIYFDMILSSFTFDSTWEEGMVRTALRVRNPSYFNRFESFINSSASKKEPAFRRELKKQILLLIPKSTPGETGSALRNLNQFLFSSLSEQTFRWISLEIAKFVFAPKQKHLLDSADLRFVYLTVTRFTDFNDPALKDLARWQDLSYEELHQYSKESDLNYQQKKSLFNFTMELNEERLFNKSTPPKLTELVSHLKLPAYQFTEQDSQGYNVSLNAQTLAKWTQKVIEQSHFQLNELREFLIEYGQVIAQARRLSKFLATDGGILLQPFLDHWVEKDETLTQKFQELYENDSEFRELWKNVKRTSNLSSAQRDRMETIDASLPGFCKLALKKLLN